MHQDASGLKISMGKARQGTWSPIGLGRVM